MKAKIPEAGKLITELIPKNDYGKAENFENVINPVTKLYKLDGACNSSSVSGNYRRRQNEAPRFIWRSYLFGIYYFN